MTTKTPTELVHRIVTHHKCISGRMIVSLCAMVGYPNDKSTQAVLFNACKAKTLAKDSRGLWSIPSKKR